MLTHMIKSKFRKTQSNLFISEEHTIDFSNKQNILPVQDSSWYKLCLHIHCQVKQSLEVSLYRCFGFKRGWLEQQIS